MVEYWMDFSAAFHRFLHKHTHTHTLDYAWLWINHDNLGQRESIEWTFWNWFCGWWQVNLIYKKKIKSFRLKTHKNWHSHRDILISNTSLPSPSILLHTITHKKSQSINSCVCMRVVEKVTLQNFFSFLYIHFDLSNAWGSAWFERDFWEFFS